MRTMKNIILFLSLVIIPILAFAQERTDSTGAKMNNVIYKTIPQKLKIKDKIIVENKSLYYILQIVIATPTNNNDLEMVGSATYIAPN